MKRRMLSKGLMFTVILLFFIILIPKGVIAEEKPDLIIEDILWEEIDNRKPPIYAFYCQVKNIGNDYVTKTIGISVKVNRLLFESIPIIPGRRFSGEGITGMILPPGYTINISFYSGMFFPSYFAFIFPGLYLLRVKVNPNRSIIESDYTNNNYCERFFSALI